MGTIASADGWVQTVQLGQAATRHVDALLESAATVVGDVTPLIGGARDAAVDAAQQFDSGLALFRTSAQHRPGGVTLLEQAAAKARAIGADLDSWLAAPAEARAGLAEVVDGAKLQTRQARFGADVVLPGI